MQRRSRNFLHCDIQKWSNSFPCFKSVCLTEKYQSGGALDVGHADAIAVMNLAGGYQIGQWLNEQALDGAPQVSGAISGIGSLHQQKLPSVIRQLNQERLSGSSGIDALF